MHNLRLLSLLVDYWSLLKDITNGLVSVDQSIIESVEQVHLNLCSSVQLRKCNIVA